MIRWGWRREREVFRMMPNFLAEEITGEAGFIGTY